MLSHLIQHFVIHFFTAMWQTKARATDVLGLGSVLRDAFIFAAKHLGFQVP